MIFFEWDSAKASSNQLKHRVTFLEARSVFFDDHALVFEDPESVGEERFLILGQSEYSRTLVVVFCERCEQQDSIRIISARKATASERAHYPG
jgi:uncharacterized DUF497 family protein